MIIQKSDKGNSGVTVDWKDYIEKMSNILSGQKTFAIVNLKDATLLNSVCQPRKHVDKVLKKLIEYNSMTGKKTENC